jgi:hypothetical protein
MSAFINTNTELKHISDAVYFGGLMQLHLLQQYKSISITNNNTNYLYPEGKCCDINNFDQDGNTVDTSMAKIFSLDNYSRRFIANIINKSAMEIIAKKEFFNQNALIKEHIDDNTPYLFFLFNIDNQLINVKNMRTFTNDKYMQNTYKWCVCYINKILTTVITKLINFSTDVLFEHNCKNTYIHLLTNLMFVIGSKIMNAIYYKQVKKWNEYNFTPLFLDMINIYGLTVIPIIEECVTYANEVKNTSKLNLVQVLKKHESHKETSDLKNTVENTAESIIVENSTIQSNTIEPNTANLSIFERLKLKVAKPNSSSEIPAIESTPESTPESASIHLSSTLMMRMAALKAKNNTS